MIPDIDIILRSDKIIRKGTDKGLEQGEMIYEAEYGCNDGATGSLYV